MILHFTYQGQDFSYHIRRRRGQRGLTLRVHSRDKIVVTTSLSFSQKEIEKFVDAQKEWIVRSLESAAKHQKIPLGLDKPFHLYKARAKKFISEKVKQWNAVYNHTYEKITVRDQSSRWGSCSESGTLSFSYKLLFLPEHLADYIVVHELCHLQEMNHSVRFWRLVAQTVPKYQACRRELRGYDLG